MRAEKAIRALLMQASAVTSLVGDRCYPGPLPEGCPLPALVVEHVSTVPLPTLDAQAGYGLMQARIQVTGLAANYPAVKTLLDAVVTACNHQRGLIGGVRVASAVRVLIGPDLRDDDRSVFYQSVDFVVIHQEP